MPGRRPALEVMAFAHLGHSSANPPYHNLSRRMVWFVTGFPARDMSGRHRQLLRILKTAYTAALCARLSVPAAEPQVDIRRLPPGLKAETRRVRVRQKRRWSGGTADLARALTGADGLAPAVCQLRPSAAIAAPTLGRPFSISRYSTRCVSTSSE